MVLENPIGKHLYMLSLGARPSDSVAHFPQPYGMDEIAGRKRLIM